MVVYELPMPHNPSLPYLDHDDLVVDDQSNEMIDW